jgi:hypothetical protein
MFSGKTPYLTIKDLSLFSGEKHIRSFLSLSILSSSALIISGRGIE